MIDVAMFLEPEGTHASVRLLKDHDNADLAETHLHLDTDTIRIASDDDVNAVSNLKPSAFTLLSGGAKGSEAAFGEAAERWGLHEINFSYPGRKTVRTRGVLELSDEELERGAVSEAVKAKLHRSFPKTNLFQRLLETVWHQVSTAGEVFVFRTGGGLVQLGGGTRRFSSSNQFTTTWIAVGEASRFSSMTRKRFPSGMTS